MKIYNPIWRIRSVNWLFFDWLVRSSGSSLLKRLNEFENPVLVGGCQRSGTTAVTKVLSSAREISPFQSGVDNELDGALILAGAIDFNVKKTSRYCFQVTYLNDSFLDICDIRQAFKLVWVIRNPWSVVYSMLFNWRDSALDQLYRHCLSNATGVIDSRHQVVDEMSKSRRRLIKACTCYCVRSSQLFGLVSGQMDGKLFVLDYDFLVSEPRRMLAEVFRFVELTLEDSHIGMLHQKSVSKAVDSFSETDRRMVEDLCFPTYSKCLELTSIS